MKEFTQIPHFPNYLINEAYKETGVSKGNINQVCNHKRETAGGFKWQYV
jgi:hypothetical protein